MATNIPAGARLQSDGRVTGGNRLATLALNGVKIGYSYWAKHPLASKESWQGEFTTYVFMSGGHAAVIVPFDGKTILVSDAKILVSTIYPTTKKEPING